MSEHKRCPYCAEEIRAEAVRCRYCRSRLTSFSQERWHRDHPERRLAGVCAGLSHTLVVPVAAVRLVFIVLTFVHLIGPILYAGLWLIMPRRPGATSPFERALQGMLDWLASIREERDGAPRPPAEPRTTDR